MLFTAAVAAGLLAQLPSTFASPIFSRNADITAQLKSQLSSGAGVYTPNDPSYDQNVTPRWTIYEEPNFSAAVVPATKEDIQKSVAIAQQNNVSFMATGGGHGYTTSYRFLQSGLQIDLQKFKTVDVDAANNRVTVGPGVRFRDVFDPLYNAKQMIATGSGTCVGMIGATLGAGVGRLQGLEGLIIDALESVELLLANGTMMNVSSTENPDLFWGMRGAGFNYGIVTSATYKTVDFINNGQVFNADLKFSQSQNQSFWEIMKTFDNGKLPAELSLFTLNIYDPDFNAPTIILNADYFGPEADGRAALKPFFDLGPIQTNVENVAWNKLGSTSLFGLDSAFCVDGENHNLYATGVKQIDVPTFTEYYAELVQFWEENPAARNTSWEIEYFGNQAVLAVPDDATAYPWRDIQAQVMLTFDYPAGNATVDKIANDLAQKGRSSFIKNSGFAQEQVYVSYGHGDETADVLYGADKLPKLLDLKKQYDPTNQFRFNNPLPYTA